MARILVIDDDELLIQTVREILEDAGHEVTTAGNGDLGLRLMREHGADLVITDIIMPEKEGIETIHELTDAYPNLPIIAISGGSRMGPLDSYLPTAQMFGACKTLAKPFSVTALLEAVNEVLERYGIGAGAAGA